MLMDRNHLPLPVAIEFDYISNGRISNTNYDLKKLAEHLLTRDDVTIHKAGKGYKDDTYDPKKSASSYEEALCKIPYYNADEGRTHTIYFRWMPKREDYLKMWEWCTSHDRKFPSTVKTEAIFALDILGLRACNASLCDTFYGTTYVEEDEDEGDEEESESESVSEDGGNDSPVTLFIQMELCKSQSLRQRIHGRGRHQEDHRS